MTVGVPKFMHIELVPCKGMESILSISAGMEWPTPFLPDNSHSIPAEMK